MEMANTSQLEFHNETRGKAKMAVRLDSGNGAASEVQERNRVRAVRDKRSRVPRWAVLLFVVLAAFAVARTLQRGVEKSKANQPPVRPALVTQVISKDVPLYLDEIGTCAAYETVQVQAQVSGKILARHFQDGAEVKKGDLLFTIDPAPYQAALDQAKAQAALDQVNAETSGGFAGQGCERCAGLRHRGGERAEIAGRRRSCASESRLLLHQIADQRTGWIA